MIRLTSQTVQELLDFRSDPAEWLMITQSQVDAFAQCTLDHQFIHVNPTAALDTPFGGTIAHGFLLLSLQTHFAQQCAPPISNVAWALNYGIDRVRFLSPVRVGSWVRGVARITRVQERQPSQFLVTTNMTLEVRGQDKPAMVAELLGLVVTR